MEELFSASGAAPRFLLPSFSAYLFAVGKAYTRGIVNRGDKVVISAAYAVGGGGVKAVAGEKTARPVDGDDLSAEKQRAAVSNFGGKLGVVRYKHHRHSAVPQLAQNADKFRFCSGVKPASRLVKQ